MVKVEVTKKNILILGHADYDNYGKDIVCAAVSATVITSIEAISRFDANAISINESKNKLEIIQNKEDDITNRLIVNMLTLLEELEKKYPKNIKITNKEE